MSCIVRGLDKRTGTVYVYESTSYWDPATKMPRCHRRLIGKVDPQSGEVVPTGKRGRRKKDVGTSPQELGSAGGDDAKACAESCEEIRLKAALLNSEERLAEQDTRIKSLEDEVRRLAYHLKRMAPTLDSIEKSLGTLREICSAAEPPPQELSP